MSENSNPNNIKEEEQKKLKENDNNLNYSFSPEESNNNNTKLKNKANITNENKSKNRISKGKILDGQFIVGEEIGKGTFGIVRIATHIITGEKVAVKMLYKEKILEESDKKRLEREIKILKILKHKNIVHLYNVFQTSSTIYLVMEYIKGKELFEIIVKKKRLSELESLQYYQQLISGIEYLGKIRVAHRDLKPENLLIDSKNVLKIADFGLSNIYKNNELLSTDCGSPCYASPEMLSGEKYFGLSSDIWSSGIILYTMLCGKLPFEDKNNSVLYQKIREGKFSIPEFLSQNAKDILIKILNVDPKKRLNISQIKSHPWFNQIDQRKYMSKGLLLNKYIVPIDEDIINKMENEYEYNSKEIRINLLKNKHNYITTTYYLILAKKIKNGKSSVCDMTSKEFLNYIHNPKNLLSSYNYDWNKILKERGIKKNIERKSTLKSNDNDINYSNKKEEDKIKNNNFNKIKTDNDLVNDKNEDFLISKNETENEKINLENDKYKIKSKFEIGNKNNGFKEKINELYENKKPNNFEDRNIEKNENKIIKKCIPNNNEKVISINLDDLNKENFTPSNEKVKKQKSNENNFVNTISFSGNSNNKNYNSKTLNTIKSDNLKNKENNNKQYINIKKFKIKKNNNSKSSEKINKIRKKTILINLNKISIENKKKENIITKDEENISTFANNTSNNKQKTSNIINQNNIKYFNKNNSSKIIYYKKDNNKNNLYKNNNNAINKKYKKYKSVNKEKIKEDINKNYNLFGNIKKYAFNDNKLSNKIIPSFSIDNNKISYNQNTNYIKKISIEGIYYAHQKNMKEINNLYNEISKSQSKKIDNK